MYVTRSYKNMSNEYTATKEQMLMKKLRRYNANVDGLVEKLKRNNISRESFVGALAALVKKCEVNKKYTHNINGRVR